MATEHNIQATGRNVEGKGASRRLRRAASIPAIIYGGKAAPQAIQLDHEKVWLASQHEWFYSSILSLDVDGKVEQVLLRDMQRHPFKQIIMHLDFQRVSANEALRAKVPLHFLNEDSSPAGKTAGVLVLHELNEVEVSCLPKDLPEFIELDLGKLAVGDIIHLSEISLPKGVELPALKLGKEHDVAVVIAKHAKEEVEEAEGAPEAAEVPATKAAKKDDK
jgi:large subunit ribosomal protein L25